ncbi:MAG: hypothetical protein KKD92_05940 [Proteobacteria bacterium]|nr:hypothetical protein [Pseudomonadota bacterium]
MSTEKNRIEAQRWLHTADDDLDSAIITGMVGSHLADFILANTDWDIYGMYMRRTAHRRSGLHGLWKSI